MGYNKVLLYRSNKCQNKELARKGILQTDGIVTIRGHYKRDLTRLE